MTTPALSQPIDYHSRIADQFSATVTNPPFDPRRYPTNPAYAGVQQGLMIRQTQSTVGGSVDAVTNTSVPTPAGIPDRVKLRFLYNPSDFTVGYSPTDAVIQNPDTSGSDAAASATLLGASTTTCSFSLLFDRTYEVNAALNTPGSQFSHLTGVNVDTVVFQQLLGIPLNGNGFPLYLPIQLYLGGVNTLAFYGVVNNSSVTYTHFSQNMVPLRAVVSVNMTQWIDSTQDTTPGSVGKTTGIYSAPRGGTSVPSPQTGQSAISGLIGQITGVPH